MRLGNRHEYTGYQRKVGEENVQEDQGDEDKEEREGGRVHCGRRYGKRALRDETGSAAASRWGRQAEGSEIRAVGRSSGAYGSSHAERVRDAWRTLVFKDVDVTGP
jgi:hypothetical protein